MASNSQYQGIDPSLVEYDQAAAAPLVAGQILLGFRPLLPVGLDPSSVSHDHHHHHHQAPPPSPSSLSSRAAVSPAIAASLALTTTITTTVAAVVPSASSSVPAPAPAPAAGSIAAAAATQSARSVTAAAIMAQYDRRVGAVVAAGLTELPCSQCYAGFHTLANFNIGKGLYNRSHNY